MTVSTRVREESGFGLVELLIAMTVMVVGITALVAGMSSGMVAVKRAGDESTAAALADTQMEAYRALPNCAIYLEAIHDHFGSAPPTPPTVRSSDITERIKTNAPLLEPAAARRSTTPTNLTMPHQLRTGADGRSYWVDTYIVDLDRSQRHARQGGHARRPRPEGHDQHEDARRTSRPNSRPQPAATNPVDSDQRSTGCRPQTRPKRGRRHGRIHI